MALDIGTFINHLKVSAKRKSRGKCARFVRLALAAGGAKPATWPCHAKDWGPTLLGLGFGVLYVADPDLQRFQKGDVIVLQPYAGGNPSGHIAAFDGKHWISDFVQTDLWAGPRYREARPRHAFYRP